MRYPEKTLSLAFCNAMLALTMIRDITSANTKNMSAEIRQDKLDATNFLIKQFVLSYNDYHKEILTAYSKYPNWHNICISCNKEKRDCIYEKNGTLDACEALLKNKRDSKKRGNIAITAAMLNLSGAFPFRYQHQR